MKGRVVRNHHLSHLPLVIPMVLLVLLLCVGHSWADDGDPPPESEPEQGEAPDGGQVPEGPPEGEGVEEGDESDDGADEGEEGDLQGFENRGVAERRQRLGLAAEFHPSYKLTYGRDQDVSKWGHDFGLSYQLSPKVDFVASSSINTRSNDILNRENRQEIWRTNLNVAVTDAVIMGVKFNRSTQVDVRNEGAPNEVRSEREKETMDLTMGYVKAFLNGVKTSLSASSGMEKNEYSDVRSRGSAQTIAAKFDYDPMENLTSSFGYSGGHSLLDSRQAEGVENQNESFDHALNGTMKYEWDVNSLETSARRSFSTMQYPKEGGIEERERESGAFSVSGAFAPMEDLKMGFDYNYSRSQAYYHVETTKDSDITGHSVKGSIEYTFSGVRFTTNLGSERKANEYFNFQTGDTHHDTFSMSLSRDFGDRFDVDLRGRMSLLSHQYEDTAANDQDRDLFEQEVTLNLSYKPRTSITASLNLKIKENDLIYMRTSRTGDNKTTQTYSLQPTLRIQVSPAVTLTQKYTLSADYAFYTFDHTSNFLIRGLSISTDLGWSPMAGLSLDATHKYTGQDEGSYVEDEFGVERYGRSSERDDHRISLKARYTFFDLIDIEAKQDLSVRRKWTIRDGVRQLSWEKQDTRFTGKASVDYKLEDDSTLRISVARTLRDAANITEQQADVWDISATLDKTF
jgi:hypothetical protein